jgi:hypothetical protein
MSQGFFNTASDAAARSQRGGQAAPANATGQANGANGQADGAIDPAHDFCAVGQPNRARTVAIRDGRRERREEVTGECVGNDRLSKKSACKQIARLKYQLDKKSHTRSKNARIKRARHDIEHRMWSFFTRVSALMAKYYTACAGALQANDLEAVADPVYFRYNGKMYRTSKDDRQHGDPCHNRGVYSRRYDTALTDAQKHDLLMQMQAAYFTSPYGIFWGARQASVPRGVLVFDFDYRLAAAAQGAAASPPRRNGAPYCKDYMPQAECLKYDQQKFCDQEAKLKAFFGTPAVKNFDGTENQPFAMPNGRIDADTPCHRDVRLSEQGTADYLQRTRQEEQQQRNTPVGQYNWPKPPLIDDSIPVQYTDAYTAARARNPFGQPVAIAEAAESDDAESDDAESDDAGSGSGSGSGRVSGLDALVAEAQAPAASRFGGGATRGRGTTPRRTPLIKSVPRSNRSSPMARNISGGRAIGRRSSDRQRAVGRPAVHGSRTHVYAGGARRSSGRSRNERR